MLSELDKLIGCFYIGKFNKEADCFLQDSIRMSLEPAKNLITSKRNESPEEEFTILGVVDY
jgi:hypothetical protein